METTTTSHLSNGAPLSPNGAAHVIPTALTIAGSDPTSGAGVQADLKTFAAHNVYGLSVITAITAQNSQGVQAVYSVSVDAIKKQCESLISDIPFKVIKTGMIYDAAAIEFITDFISGNNLIAVVDTPFMSSDGTALMPTDALKIFSERLLPVAEIITPNIREAEMLTSVKIESKDDMEQAATSLLARGASAVLIKGGHLDGNESPDFLATQNSTYWLDAERIPTPNVHGTGCALSAAIAANLANGLDLYTSVINAKAYVREAISNSISIGSGSHMLGHFSQKTVEEIF
jgi:hydroxymethylpyrimidine kinase/phosphomethylpyrimidine kinase